MGDSESKSEYNIKPESGAYVTERSQRKAGGLKYNMCASGMLGTAVLLSIFTFLLFGGAAFEYDAMTRLEDAGLLTGSWTGDEGEVFNSFLFEIFGVICFFIGFIAATMVYHYVLRRSTKSGHKVVKRTASLCGVIGAAAIFFLVAALGLIITSCVFFGMNWSSTADNTIDHEYDEIQFILSIVLASLVFIVFVIFTVLIITCVRWEVQDSVDKNWVLTLSKNTEKKEGPVESRHPRGYSRLDRRHNN